MIVFVTFLLAILGLSSNVLSQASKNLYKDELNHQESDTTAKMYMP
jgi:hypothetical protein